MARRPGLPGRIEPVAMAAGSKSPWSCGALHGQCRRSICRLEILDAHERRWDVAIWSLVMEAWIG